MEVCELWRVPTPDADNISGSFYDEEFLAALQYFKPGKAPDPDAICPKLIIHAKNALKSWLHGFLSSCLQ